MNKTASRESESRKRGMKPTTYRRIVTRSLKGKTIVQSDEPLLAYEFKTVPGYEHALMWINNKPVTMLFFLNGARARETSQP